MPSKEKRMFQLNYVRSESRVMHDSCLQNLNLYLCLPVELGLVTDDL